MSLRASDAAEGDAAEGGEAASDEAARHSVKPAALVALVPQPELPH